MRQGGNDCVMSKPRDELYTAKISRESTDRLLEVAARMKEKMKIEPSLASLVNAAVELGLPELEKQNQES